MGELLAYFAAGLVALWGLAHAIPTRRVAAGFGAVTVDNRRVILQKWLAEAFTMWGLAAVVVATVVGGAELVVTAALYRVAACLLVGLAGLTAVTGARTRAMWFKICPVLLSVSAVLLLVASTG